MNKEIANLIVQIARIRNVDVNYVCETLRASSVAGLKRRYGPDTEADAEVTAETGDIRVFLAKNVVEKVGTTAREISDISSSSGFSSVFKLRPNLAKSRLRG